VLVELVVFTNAMIYIIRIARFNGKGILVNMQDSLKSQSKKTVTLNNDRFAQMLVEQNGLDHKGFESWIFCPGMQFNSMKKWWGDHGHRDFPHEGVDLCLYRDHANRMLRLDEKNRIPAIYGGVVKAIFKDYLGKAVIIEHENWASDDQRLLSIYAHTNPRNHIHIGAVVKQGDIIATLSDTSRSKANIIPHLHFSLGLPSASLCYDPFVWNIIRKPDLITLLDPLEVVELPYQALDPDNPYCLDL